MSPLNQELLRERLKTANRGFWMRGRMVTFTRAQLSAHTRTIRVLGTFTRASFSCAQQNGFAVLRTPGRLFAVRLHAIDCSLWETKEILRLFGVDTRINQYFSIYLRHDIFGELPAAQPKWVTVDEIEIKINNDLSCVCSAIPRDWKQILGVRLFGRHETAPSAVFLHCPCQKHDLSDIVFFVG